MSNVTVLPLETRSIEAPAVEGISLADLYLSDMNPRQQADPEGISLLADSIAMIGLIQPIAGFRDEAGKVGVVAGGRRWRAIRLALERDPALAAERPDLALVPVRLAPDEATARAWAAVENTAREDLHPADEIRAFGRMREGGADVPTIARTFGITEAHVYRRLALAALPAPVLTGHAAHQIENAKDDAPKSPYSGALVADLQAMRSAAVQGALLDKPELALDLLAYTFAEKWGGPLAVRTDESPITPATQTGFAPDPRLLGREDEDEDAAPDPFDAFRAKGKKHRNAVLALALARSLRYSDRDPIFAKVEAEAKAHIRQVWTPTAENFFGRVSADYLDALHLDLTGCDPQCNGFKAFKSQKKGEKAAGMERLFTDAAYQAAWKIDAEKKARIDAWVPDCI